MRRKTKAVSGLPILFLLSITLHAQVIWAGHCKIDMQAGGPLPSCATEKKGSALFIVREFVEPLGKGQWTRVGETELAWTVLATGFAYFNRSGKIVVTDAAILDNGPSPFHEGLVRVKQNNKWGLRNANGNPVVPLEYDGILEFDDGRWLACKGCTTKSTGEYHFFSGGSWVAIDKFGGVMGPVDHRKHNGK